MSLTIIHVCVNYTKRIILQTNSSSFLFNYELVTYMMCNLNLTEFCQF